VTLASLSEEVEEILIGLLRRVAPAYFSPTLGEEARAGYIVGIPSGGSTSGQQANAIHLPGS
jgi:hypothetical protein